MRYDDRVVRTAPRPEPATGRYHHHRLTTTTTTTPGTGAGPGPGPGAPVPTGRVSRETMRAVRVPRVSRRVDRLCLGRRGRGLFGVATAVFAYAAGRPQNPSVTNTTICMQRGTALAA